MTLTDIATVAFMTTCGIAGLYLALFPLLTGANHASPRAIGRALNAQDPDRPWIDNHIAGYSYRLAYQPPASFIDLQDQP
jgi:hypothetical protein